MDKSPAADGVVSHFEPERLRFAAIEVLYRLDPHPKAYSFLEVRLVHRMGEADRRDHLLDLGVRRIFIELLVLDRSAEIRRSERVSIVLEQDMRGEELTV